MASKGRGWNSIVGVLRHWAFQSADKTAVIYEAHGGGEQTGTATALSYSLLDINARRIAATLQAEGLVGERVLLLAQGMPFITALLGCFYAGVIPVPCHQPRALPKHWQRMQAIIASADVRAVIGEYEYLAAVNEWAAALPGLAGARLISVEHLGSGDAALWREPLIRPDQPALIQFTSGSTATPKGVLVSHGNIIHNQQIIQRATRGSEATVTANWLPLFHDMGLMGGLIHPLFVGGQCVLCPPADFVQRPLRWLRLITKYGATMSGGPNFAYAYTTQRVKENELSGLDLSSWKVAFCGAEPVRADTLRAFARHVADCGFSAHGFLPCYGMAETTLMVSGRCAPLEQHVHRADRAALMHGRYRPAADEPSAQTLVSCGRADEYLDVVIADPHSGCEMPADCVGEVWIAGDSVAREYWRESAATRERFNAWLRDAAGRPLRGPFLRSGDLGLLHDGELIITGRLKDLIIIRGRNYYPHDLEWSVGRAHPDLATSAVAALGISADAMPVKPGSPGPVLPGSVSASPVSASPVSPDLMDSAAAGQMVAATSDDPDAGMGAGSNELHNAYPSCSDDHWPVSALVSSSISSPLPASVSASVAIPASPSSATTSLVPPRATRSSAGTATPADAMAAGEKLVIVAEIRRGDYPLDVQAVFSAIREVLWTHHELVADDIALIAPGSLLRTSSGKVRRADIAQCYVQQTLELAVPTLRQGSVTPTRNPLAGESEATAGLPLAPGAATGAAADHDAALMEHVRDCLARALRLPPRQVALDRPPAAQGLDSLRAALFCAELEERLGYRVGLADVLAARDVAELLQRCVPLNTANTATADTSAAADGDGRAGAAGRDAAPHLVAATDAFPLTDMQQAYWVGRGDVFELGGRSLQAYLEVVDDGVDGGAGKLDIARFQQAWNLLVQRHDMLRAVITQHGQQQILAQVPEYRIAMDDLRGATAAQSERHLQQLRERMTQQCLDVTRWPAFEIRATRLSGACHLHLCVDGLFLDFRSFQLLFRELLVLYTALPGVAALPALPAYRFRDYVLALPRARQRPEYAHAWRYWQRQLPCLPAAPQLPLANDPASLDHADMERRQYHMEAPTWRLLREQAMARGLTPAALLLAVYGEVLARWSQEQCFTVNVPLFNRPRDVAEARAVIGNFSSFTLVAMNFSQCQSFAARARAVQDNLHRAIDHSQVSGVELLRELARQHGQANARAFPVVFTYLPAGLDDWDSDVLTQIERGLGRIVQSRTHTPQVWLDNQIWHENGGLRLHWDGVEALFPAAVLDEMFTAFCGLLERLARDEATWQCAALDLLPARQRRLFATANGQRHDLPAGTVIEWIAARAQQQPQALAVVDGEHQLTYRATLHAADQLAHRLEQQGVTRGDRVAVLLQKGWRQVVAVLGIQRAGAAYVPLETEAPPERLVRVLTDCQAAALVGEERTLAGAAEWPVRCLNMDDAAITTTTAAATTSANAPERAPCPSLSGDDLAYVIYTSGTTGQPKGVMVSQRNLAGLVAMTNRHFQVGSGDRMLSVTALHHDLSVYDIFGVLSAGGCVVMPAHHQQRDPQHWLALLREHQITLWNSVPALLDMLLTYAEGDRQPLPASLRQGWAGGDWVSIALARKARRLLPAMALCSIGGPTETTVWNIWYPLPDDLSALDKVPYGRPAPNNQYHILNSAGEACPVWVPGELYCGGMGVALGYWNNAHETARRFVHHPRSGERLYRSGDLGRWLPDGTIEFMGRLDQQIKIQGVRIEAGEVEACILRHCAVAAAVVGSVGEGAQKALAAWVVPGSAQPAAETLLARTGPVITDIAERITFKLEQRGRRHWRGATTELPGRPREDTAREVYLQRQSVRHFLPCSVNRQQLGEWLAALAQLRLEGKMLPKYRYPSGGGLYPVQVYLYVRGDGVQDLTAGYYYYDPAQHRLVLINDQHPAPPPPPGGEAMAGDSAFTLWLVADLNAIEPLYGQLARDFCLLEAGYMGQLLMSAASGQGIGLCPLGYHDENVLRTALHLESKHQVLHGMVGGRIDPLQLSDWHSEETQHTPRVDRRAGIQQTLGEHLPAALVPRHVIVVNRLPLTANGKVDRAALPRPGGADHSQADHPQPLPPDGGAASASGGAERQTTPLQDQLLGLWRELLGTDTVGLDDNFFSLGGNSNLLVQAHARVQQYSGRAVPVAALFKYPTIRRLAVYLLSDDKDQSSVAETDERGRRQRDAMRRLRARKATKYV